jgi:hypothetical protein
VTSSKCITVSGACSDQLEVNAIATADFRSLRVLLDFLSILIFSFVCGLLQVRVGLALELWIKRLEFFSFFICSQGGFIVTSTSYLMKYL